MSVLGYLGVPMSSQGTLRERERAGGAERRCRGRSRSCSDGARAKYAGGLEAGIGKERILPEPPEGADLADLCGLQAVRAVR